MKVYPGSMFPKNSILVVQISLMTTMSKSTTKMSISAVIAILFFDSGLALIEMIESFRGSFNFLIFLFRFSSE